MTASGDIIIDSNVDTVSHLLLPGLTCRLKKVKTINTHNLNQPRTSHGL